MEVFHHPLNSCRCQNLFVAAVVLEWNSQKLVSLVSFVNINTTPDPAKSRCFCSKHTFIYSFKSQFYTAFKIEHQNGGGRKKIVDVYLKIFLLLNT